MGRIHRLPDTLINQIAAGEVVERPASVVKELVENALDAGAKTITVRLEDGGRQKIQVDDDGSGMDSEDVLLALERHATSKISSPEDLTQLQTLGFRGEALPSIAAVAELALETAPHEGEGSRIQVHFGRLLGQEPCGRPQGTRVTVEKLFARTPARLKFLRSSATELRYIVETIQALAFAYPEVAFALWHGERKLFHLPSAKDRSERLFQLLRAAPPPPVQAQSSDFQAELFLLPPTPSHQLVVVVNQRVVKDRLLAGTLGRSLRSVKGEWQADLFLHLTVPSWEVDFNVHPAKAEVRFTNPGKVMAFLTEHVRVALEKRHRVTVVHLPSPNSEVRIPGSQSWSHRPWSVAEAPAPAFAFTPQPAVSLAPSGEGWGRYLGQYRNTYLLVEAQDGLKLVDQHVAHERVLYEQLLSRQGREISQALLIPEVLELSPHLYALVAEHHLGLREAGVELELLSGNSARLAALPAGVPVSRARALVLGLLEDLQGAHLPGQSLREQIAASLACRAAIKKNTPLAPAPAEQLLRDLEACRDPHKCPHGRPIVLLLPHEEIERRIGRRGG